MRTPTWRARSNYRPSGQHRRSRRRARSRRSSRQQAQRARWPLLRRHPRGRPRPERGWRHRRRRLLGRRRHVRHRHRARPFQSRLAHSCRRASRGVRCWEARWLSRRVEGSTADYHVYIEALPCDLYDGEGLQLSVHADGPQATVEFHVDFGDGTSYDQPHYDPCTAPFPATFVGAGPRHVYAHPGTYAVVAKVVLHPCTGPTESMPEHPGPTPRGRAAVPDAGTPARLIGSRRRAVPFGRQKGGPTNGLLKPKHHRGRPSRTPSRETTATSEPARCFLRQRRGRAGRPGSTPSWRAHAFARSARALARPPSHSAASVGVAPPSGRVGPEALLRRKGPGRRSSCRPRSSLHWCATSAHLSRHRAARSDRAPRPCALPSTRRSAGGGRDAPWFSRTTPFVAFRSPPAYPRRDREHSTRSSTRNGASRERSSPVRLPDCAGEPSVDAGSPGLNAFADPHTGGTP